MAKCRKPWKKEPCRLYTKAIFMGYKRFVDARFTMWLFVL